ncbi:MAG TPA: hypothetical protein DCP92_10295 [Nitrospiraceae bacterium]|nr:hypothetical protein [Nitrospiraceae bacterium]
MQIKGRFLHIRYFAVRDSQGTYKGTLEVSQDITHIRKLESRKGCSIGMNKETRRRMIRCFSDRSAGGFRLR